MNNTFKYFEKEGSGGGGGSEGVERWSMTADCFAIIALTAKLFVPQPFFCFLVIAFSFWIFQLAMCTSLRMFSGL